MLHAGTWLELIDEFYGEGQMYWRLAVKPWKKRGLGRRLRCRLRGMRGFEWRDGKMFLHDYANAEARASHGANHMQIQG